MNIFDNIKNQFGSHSNNYDSDDFENNENPTKKNKKDNKIISINNYSDLSKSFDTENEDDDKEKQIAMIKPKSFEEAIKISNWIEEEKIIVLSVELLTPKLTQRLIDFISGALYIKKGEMFEMTKGEVFVCIPSKYGSILDINSLTENTISKLNLKSANNYEEIKPKFNSK
ncbi:MAG: cell division inhibitor SepF [Fusobacteriaceae bacterium]|jgi:cell division inhibitor SepF|nr:sepF [Fusobacteriales bacterium]MDN5304217.1 cell division inhibitor SepF [Fusobacteriaceae bacterium]